MLMNVKGKEMNSTQYLNSLPDFMADAVRGNLALIVILSKLDYETKRSADIKAAGYRILKSLPLNDEEMANQVFFHTKVIMELSKAESEEGEAHETLQ